MKNEPKITVEIPTIENYDLYERNRDKAWENNAEPCPCCGKELKNPKFFIQSIYGGSMFPKEDTNFYDDAWIMGVGSECRKRIPSEYLLNAEDLKKSGIA